MKIFNWVQRRFHHNVLKDGLARNVKKTDSIAIDSNTKALLQQAAFSDMLDGWRDGILTIGTFGFDHLKSSAEQNEFLTLGSYNHDEAEQERHTSNIEGEDDDDDDVDIDDDDDDDDDYDGNNSDEEMNPLMLSTLEHSLEDVDSNGKNEVRMKVDNVWGSTYYENEIKFEFEFEAGDCEGHSGKLSRRTTLAELFSEDLDIKKKPSNSSKKSSTVRTKNGVSFAKKLIPQAGEDSRPIKMIHQMMKRMLKRKIHPELGNKGEGQCKASVVDAPEATEESVSLLQSPDVAIP